MDTEMVALEITTSGAPWRAGPGDWETSATARSPVDKEKELSGSAKVRADRTRDGAHCARSRRHTSSLKVDSEAIVAVVAL
jgi:hypothetical protein